MLRFGSGGNDQNQVDNNLNQPNPWENATTPEDEDLSFSIDNQDFSYSQFGDGIPDPPKKKKEKKQKEPKKVKIPKAPKKVKEQEEKINEEEFREEEIQEEIQEEIKEETKEEKPKKEFQIPQININPNVIKLVFLTGIAAVALFGIIKMSGSLIGNKDVNPSNEPSSISSDYIDDTPSEDMIDLSELPSVEPTPSIEPSVDNSINVTFTVDKNENHGHPYFTVKTNLPENTRLAVTLSNNRGYRETQTGAVIGGNMTTQAFTNNGGPLTNGNYDITIEMAENQVDSVMSVLGEFNKNLTGPYVVNNSANKTATRTLGVKITQGTQPLPSVNPSTNPSVTPIVTPSSNNTNNTIIVNPLPSESQPSQNVTYYPSQNTNTNNSNNSNNSNNNSNNSNNNNNNNTNNNNPPVQTQPTSQDVAVNIAKNILSSYALSRTGLYNALVQSGVSSSDASYAVDNCGANWNAQATNSANNYLSTAGGVSYSTVVMALEAEGFTESQASYGASNCGADWNQQALECARNYIAVEEYDETALMITLERDGFSLDEIYYAMGVLGYY